MSPPPSRPQVEAGPRHRGPRPAARRPRPRRPGRQRRRPGPPGAAASRSGSPASRCAAGRSCAGCSPGRASPGSSPTRCPRRCGSAAATTRSAATSSSATRRRTARRSPAGGRRVAPPRVTLMVDSTEQLDLIDAVVPPGPRPAVRICLDVDASLRLAGGRVHVGVRRSPVHSADDAAALARTVVARRDSGSSGLMAYEAQIAGVQDDAAGGLRTGSPSAGCRRCPPASWPSAGRRRRGRLRRRPAGVRQRRRHRQRRADRAEHGRHRGRRRLGPLLPRAVRRLPQLHRAAGGVLRRPGDPRARARHVTVAGGGWVASGPPGPTGCRCPPTRPACPGSRPRAPARCRRRCAARGRRSCGSATACGSGTRRPASSASTSTCCTPWTATSSPAPCRPTAARARVRLSGRPPMTVGRRYGAPRVSATRTQRSASATRATRVSSNTGSADS